MRGSVSLKIARVSRRRFVQSTALGMTASGLGVGAVALAEAEYGPLPQGRPAVLGEGDGPHFINWTGNVRCRPQAMITPQSLPELQAAVAGAKKVKAVGSGHSFSPCAHADRDTIMIRTDGLARWLDLDRESRLVRVEAGIKLHALNDLLASHGLALPSLGDIEMQSIAGALATGTHGTGLKWGSLSDEAGLRGMELVLADGSLLSLAADRPSDGERLAAARIGLGALGVVYSVTLKVDVAHQLEAHSRIMSLNEALDARHWRDNDHYEFFRFPFTDLAQVVTRNRTDRPADRRPLKTFWDKIVLENAALGTVLHGAALAPSLMPKVMALLAAMTPDERRVDRSDRIMTSKRWVRAYELEYAVPLAQAQAAQQAYGDVVAEFSQRGDPYFVSFPSECRFIRGDRGALLSPTSTGDSCYLSVMSHTAFRGHESFFRAIEQRLLALGGRPHWGKLFYQNPVSLYGELFSRFDKVRRQLDPHEAFRNLYIDRLLDGRAMPLGVRGSQRNTV